MGRIGFTFSPEKFVAALAFLADSELPDLTTLKVAKLLYFADKRHLLAHGRPIIGDTYFGMKDGPVPSVAYRILKGATAKEASPEWRATESLFRAYIEVVPAPSVNGHSRFRARKPADLETLSRSDIEALEAVRHDLGSLPAAELRARAHLEPDYLAAEAAMESSGRKRAPMPYESFFQGHDEAREVMALVLAEQQNRDFHDRL